MRIVGRIMENDIERCTHVVIRRKSDGVTRTCEVGLFTSQWWWEEGNGRCDCNRRAAFEQSINPDYRDNGPCSRDEYEIVDFLNL